MYEEVRMKKYLDLRYYILEIVISLILVMLVVVSFSQVIARYVFKISLSWSEELARYLLLWFGMLTAAYCFKIKVHFALTFVFKKFPFVIRKIVNIFIFSVLNIIFLVMIIWGFKYAYMAIGTNSPVIKLPLPFVYSAIPIGGGLMLFYNIINFYRSFIKNKKYEVPLMED